MEERFQLIERKLVDVDDVLEKIAAQLSGDGSELAPGVIGILLSHTDTIAGHKTRIDRLERTIDRFRWTLAGASGLGGIIGGGAVAIFSQIQGNGL